MDYFFSRKIRKTEKFLRLEGAWCSYQCQPKGQKKKKKKRDTVSRGRELTLRAASVNGLWIREAEGCYRG